MTLTVYEEPVNILSVSRSQNDHIHTHLITLNYVNLHK